MRLGKWLRDHPRWLERAFGITHRLFFALQPTIAWVGYQRIDRWLRPGEELAKKALFDCRMCGQCILHSTGMTCPMTCPKNMRNGPCGGVRANGNCEVIPDMKCVWLEAVDRSQAMPRFGNEIVYLQPPVNKQLKGTSAWINMLTGQDLNVPAGWSDTVLQHEQA